MSRLRNPVQTCGWCTHPMEMHDFTDAGPVEVPCAQCPDNTCSLSELDHTLTERYTLARLYDANDCS